MKVQTSGCVIVGTTLTILLLHLNKPELVPQLWLSIIVAILGYLALIYNSEKVRLGLFDRRFEIYSKTIDYCNVVQAYASLERRDENREHINNAITAAHESFRGIGYHKTRALFGQDIVTLFDKLNKSYAYIVAYGRLRSEDDRFDADTYWGHVTQTVDLTKTLPDYFRPYIYFGDHKQV
jgi:hypothetical protein